MAACTAISKDIERMYHKDKHIGVRYLAVDALNLAVLVLEFGSHVERHVTKVTDHSVHLTHVFFHLIFASIICYPANTIVLVCIGITF